MTSKINFTEENEYIIHFITEIKNNIPKDTHKEIFMKNLDKIYYKKDVKKLVLYIYNNYNDMRDNEDIFKKLIGHFYNNDFSHLEYEILNGNRKKDYYLEILSTIFYELKNYVYVMIERNPHLIGY